MEKVYTRINWEDYPSANTALSAANMNKMDYAIEELDNRVISLDAETASLESRKADQETVDQSLAALSTSVSDLESGKADQDVVDGLADHITNMEIAMATTEYVDQKVSTIDSHAYSPPVSNLSSTADNAALAASQGKVLNDKIIEVEARAEELQGHYCGTCSTAGSTAAKTVTISDFVLKTGVEILVKFSNENTSSAATLNVNSTGSKAMYHLNGDRMYYIPSGIYHHFKYDGTYWRYLYSADAIIGGRTYERFGIKMLNSAMIPVKSSLGMDLGTGTYSFNRIFAKYLGSSSYPAAEIYANAVKTTVGSYVGEVLPALPLVQGDFSILGDYTISLNEGYGRYYKYITSGMSGIGGCGSGSYSGYYTQDEVLLLLRIIGYEDMAGSYEPFIFDVALSTTATMDGCASTGYTNCKVLTTDNGSEITIFLTGLYNCGGCVVGTPSIRIETSSTLVRFLEIDLMP